MILILAAAAAAAAAPYDFQGVPIGTSLQEVQARYADLSCNPGEFGQVCSRKAAMFGEELTVDYSFTGSSSTLYKIALYFPYRVATEVEAGLTGRWGEPETLIDLAMWKQGPYRITLKRAYPRGFGFAVISDGEVQERLEKEKQARSATSL